jgi:NADH oxidase (H2O-forming)
MKDNKILKITKDVSWIGILDFDIVTFDVVMETEYGTTYNSYFINADKKVIVETAKEKFSDVYFNKIEQVVKYEDIDYIVLNHTEPDHSGSLAKLLEKAPQATVVGSGQAIKYLGEIVPQKFNSLIVKDGDTLDLGNKTLQFISAPNLHWPDSIYTYLPEDKVLFTCDSFGAHYCTEEMFDDFVDDYSDSFKYYFDVILKPFSKFMLKAIEKIKDLDIDIIATGHGPILRSTWKDKVEQSKKWAEEYVSKTDNNNKKVLITYVSAYGYTREMGEHIADGIHKAGIENVELLDIEKIDLGELDSKIITSDAILVGCPTINQNILMPVYKMFAVINPIRDRGKFATAFGSYGWSGEGIKIMEASLKSLKLNVIQSPINMKFRPTNENIEELKEFGKAFGEKIRV